MGEGIFGSGDKNQWVMAVKKESEGRMETFGTYGGCDVVVDEAIEAR